MRTKIFASVLAVSIAAGSAMAYAETVTKTTTTKVQSKTVAPVVTANTAVNTNVAVAGDNSPVVLTGVVKSVGADEFVLSYGTGDITVEMEGWKGWDAASMKNLRVGERVTVTGRIDDDLFEGREVEASNIYLNSDNIYYYREGTPSYPILGSTYYGSQTTGNAALAEDGTFVAMSGRVSKVSPTGKEFTLVGDNQMTMQVDLGELGYNPMDNEGIQRVREGDLIQVYGEIDEDFFERKEIMASRVISLMNR